jgi:alkanesulfonate monooxygenase SsuD/methylene tetrahydromethanopterin reductase-like flavin-dependent oxidoreductase (luciferase family)
VPIQFGIFDHIEMSGDQGVEALYESRIAFLKRAEEAGFYGFHLAEHHGHRLSASPSASVFLAASPGRRHG